STRGRSRRVDTIFRAACVHFAFASSTRQAYAGGSDRRWSLHDRTRALANDIHRTLRPKRRFRCSAHLKNKLTDRANKSSSAARLVLGAQSLEIASAEFSSRELQTRRLFAAGNFGR